MKRYLYSQPDNAPLYDIELPQTAYRLYNILVDIVDKKTHQIDIEVRLLAIRLNRSIRTTRRILSLLVNMGIIGRIFHKSKISKMNLSNTFIVFGRKAKRYENSEYAGDYPVAEDTKMSVPTDKNGTQKKERDSLRENKNLTLKREAKTPLPAEYDKDRKRQARTLALQNVPDILRTTAEYLLQKTDRFHITQHELEVLRKLADTHTPVRIQKEIDKCCERFILRNKNLRQLTFHYIGKCLENQRSLVRKKPKATAETCPETQIKAPVTASEVEQVQECPMPIEEAQQVISEYVPVKQNDERLAPETEELYTRIKKEYPSCEITLEEYLKLKYPEAEEEELRTDNIRDEFELEEAKKIDIGCATCESPDNCQLPNRYKIGGMRPYAILKADERGQKYIQICYGGCIKCKHGEIKQCDPEFERRLKNSGLTEMQAHQTFENHEHENMSPEIVIAKAQAILAAKKNTSLILSGQAGTGKTHLATSIAIDVMRQGRQALFRNVPEMLDELRERARNHDDFYYTMRKYKDVSCLVLDDLGKEKTTQAGLDYLYQIIDYRYRNGKQTIVTTNAQSMEGLKNRWNEGAIEPLISRLLENGTWVTIREAENRRLKKRVLPEKSEETVKSVTEPETSRREILPEPTAQERYHNLQEILEYRRKHGKFPPEYEKLEQSDQILLQRQLMAEYRAAQEKQTRATIPSIPEADDGLDDEEEDLRLYGDTGLPRRR